jgi:hypothetical protein
MCDHLPELSPEAAADRLADRLDVPELSAGVLDRERDRQAAHYLKTDPGQAWTSGPYPWPLDQPGETIDPDWLYRGPWGPLPHLSGRGPLLQGLPEASVGSVRLIVW